MSNSFSKKLIDWYGVNQRKLPWRNVGDPYLIWLSEVILQQTRIEQGLEYFLRFRRDYPTVRDLASASEEQVLKSWQGLGYYSRARNMHSAAKYIIDELNGEFPKTYEGLLRLKGVGPYTAAAIASFAYRLPYPVIDGNVYRFVSRCFGIDTPIATPMAYKEFEGLLLTLIDREHPDLFNQAMMDFGSTFCRPTAHDCVNCIFHDICVANEKGKVDLLPVRSGRVKTRDRYFYYFHVCWREGEVEMTLLHQRQGDDIWRGLYEFPLLETSQPISQEKLLEEAHRFALGLTDKTPRNMINTMQIVYKLTHQTIHAVFFDVFFDEKVVPNKGYEQPTSLEMLKKRPFPRLIDRYLQKNRQRVAATNEKSVNFAIL
ncbi:MAG: A/G-specific adenine glycosylase [Bacteroidales bacterium]|nr:A/G-specific adenine glycosylase [Bacteroidales bacterium]